MRNNSTDRRVYAIKKWTTAKLEDVGLDARTLKYIEYLTEEQGQKALDKYLKWTGWYEVGKGSEAERRQTSVPHRLFRAAVLAPTVRWKR